MDDMRAANGTFSFMIDTQRSIEERALRLASGDPMAVWLFAHQGHDVTSELVGPNAVRFACAACQQTIRFG